MPLLEDILVWTTTDLTQWQRDAVRRLFQKQMLDQQDYDDLYAMLKSAHGLSDLHNRQPVFLSQGHLPSQKANAVPIVLRAMRDLKHVNRIAVKQKLEFIPKGITIIYGGNSSGKSGYSRVLKRACRALVIFRKSFFLTPSTPMLPKMFQRQSLTLKLVGRYVLLFGNEM